MENDGTEEDVCCEYCYEKGRKSMRNIIVKIVEEECSPCEGCIETCKDECEIYRILKKVEGIE